MDYAHLNLEHFFARNDDLDVIRDRADFVMINNFTNEMMYRDGQIEGTIEGTIDLNQYYYKNRSNAASFIMMDYKKETK
ncbi:putative staphylococcal protein [Staphylococcus aureus]|uniref:hypothetical protein n=1 Tax=Staphylococcus aureus TaxID=1280 RepID=UPI000E04D032|nr:hypothetical protein [Staphylococcus aureus]SUL01703.1 putative staphylococcal protein [Staphylococcus aureus]HCV1821119.1 hypothetical protein [Staphylococcus aureus]HCV1823720.1 hypothetical protein [Staphylococcus aureus]HCV4562173.1 hypothetical protein [Staphylococcus aureus]HCV4564496.1 hypothetical protein [Staphylococcus aureus]